MFRDAARLLRPGGRLAISDIVTEVQLPQSIVCNATLWADSIGGAAQQDDRELIETAGLRVAAVEDNPGVSDRFGQCTGRQPEIRRETRVDSGVEAPSVRQDRWASRSANGMRRRTHNVTVSHRHLSRMATAGLGISGFAIGYLPIATGIAAGLTGVRSILGAFSHDNAHWRSGPE